jgi:outer membrane protein assembly factor BamB
LTRSAEPPLTPAGAILCLDADDGRAQWRFDVPDAVMSRPLVHAGDVYFGCRDGYAYCADLEQGELRWKQNLDSPIVASPVMVDASPCFVATAGQVYLMDAAVGTIDAMFDLTAHTGLKSHLYSPPAVAPEGSGRWRLYLGAELEGALGHKAAVVCLMRDAKGLAPQQRDRP